MCYKKYCTKNKQRFFFKLWTFSHFFYLISNMCFGIGNLESGFSKSTSIHVLESGFSRQISSMSLIFLQILPYLDTSIILKEACVLALVIWKIYFPNKTHQVWRDSLIWIYAYIWELVIMNFYAKSLRCHQYFAKYFKICEVFHVATRIYFGFGNLKNVLSKSVKVFNS